MAHIDHNFLMKGDPAAAQEQFLSDLLPELAKDGMFHLVHEQPGEAVFSDALELDAGREDEAAAMRGERARGDEEELGDGPPASGGVLGGPVRGTPTGGAGTYWGSLPVSRSGGDTLLARHLHVEFSAAADGTAVRIHGHARKVLRDALELLGTAGHWPETAGLPHD
jgi:hypothetical protein